MGLIKDDLGIEVEESILQMAKDPKFQQTHNLLAYREARIAKERELADAEKKKKDEETKPKGWFGLFE